MKFAHMSDCHIGSWNSQPEMREMPVVAFEKSLDICIQEKVDFIIIAGDLFDTSIPPLDMLARTVKAIRKCKETGIRIYCIPGSHDFSPTGKTFLSVLENAGLLVNVARGTSNEDKILLTFTKDETGALITGVIGRYGSLEKSIFERLDRSIENIPGKKILVFHSAITEYKPSFLKDIDSIPLSLLPKNFDYYASGHVHDVLVRKEEGFGTIAYPGALFPANFMELEKYNSSFFIVEDSEIKKVNVSLCSVENILLKADGKSASKIENDAIEAIEKSNPKGKIVLIRIEGMIDGKTSDIDFRRLASKAAELGAITFKRNISALKTADFKEVKIRPAASIEQLETDIIREHLGQVKISYDEELLTKSMIDILKEEKLEGETNSSYEARIIERAKKLFEIES